MERLNKKGNGVQPMCWWIFNICETDGSMCIIDVPDCPYECLVFNL